VAQRGAKPPTVFVSYSHDDAAHKRWVRDLAAKLRQNDIAAKLDSWDVAPGDSLTEFMESLSPADKVIAVLTPAYARKANGRAGGVGYEGQIITGELATGVDSRKFIPIIRAGSFENEAADYAIPTWCIGRFTLDFRDQDERIPRRGFADLLKAIRGEWGGPDLITPSMATRASTTHDAGFRADEGYTEGGLKRAIRQHVEAGYEPADILRHFAEDGVPRDQIRHVLSRHFGLVIP